jgi:hypothetical protein
MVHRRMLRHFCRGVLLLCLPVQFALAQVGGVGDEWRWAHFGPGSGLVSGIGQGCISAGFDGLLLVIPPHLYNVTASGATKLDPSLNGHPLSVQRAFAVDSTQIMVQGDTAIYLLSGDSTVLLPSPYQHPFVKVPDSQFGLYQTGNDRLWLNSPCGFFRWIDATWDPWYSSSGERYLIVHSVVENARGEGALSSKCKTGEIEEESSTVTMHKWLDLIHERLYQSEELAYIDFGEYVRGVVSYLARSYSVPNAGSLLTSRMPIWPSIRQFHAG